MQGCWNKSIALPGIHQTREKKGLLVNEALILNLERCYFVSYLISSYSNP